VSNRHLGTAVNIVEPQADPKGRIYNRKRLIQITIHNAEFTIHHFPRLYAIIDAAKVEQRSPLAIFDMLVSAGVEIVQYRNKEGSPRQLFDTSQQLAERARKCRTTFIVNDRADIALIAGADGVHLGQDDLPVALARRLLRPGTIVGSSTHSITQVEEANRFSADYIALGPVFPTQSKERPDPTVGLEGVRSARKATPKPLVAIGGITVENARAVIEAGADAVAVISDLLKHPDVASRAQEFLRILGSANCR
jgi:thiamine-phosphate pyrophosphorylase